MTTTNPFEQPKQEGDQFKIDFPNQEGEVTAESVDKESGPHFIENIPDYEEKLKLYAYSHKLIDMVKNEKSLFRTMTEAESRASYLNEEHFEGREYVTAGESTADTRMPWRINFNPIFRDRFRDIFARDGSVLPSKNKFVREDIDEAA